MHLIRKHWDELNEEVVVKFLAANGPPRKHDTLYGVPRGGVHVAQILAAKFNLPLVESLDDKENVLVVDDIIDSGKTRDSYTSNGYRFFAPYHRVNGSWMEFPWERMRSEAPGEDAVIRILEVLGEDVKRDGLKDTPRRVVKSWEKLYGGYAEKPEDILRTTFDEHSDEMIVLSDIDFYSTCEHHMLPFFGKVHIAYIPDKRVVGISKLARLVEVFARRLQIQERMTNQISETMMDAVKPLGVGVVVEGRHTCMMVRGVEKQNSLMTTSSLQGVFREEEVRSEFLRLIKR